MHFSATRGSVSANGAAGVGVDVGVSKLVRKFGILLAAIALVFLVAGWQMPGAGPRGGSTPTFYKDVLPILQNHCQSCHRVGEVAPMPLVTYEQTRAWAGAMAHAVEMKTMPPWFADPRYGHFTNDVSLSPRQIATISAWAAGGAPAGDARDTPTPRKWASEWNIPQPDLVVQMPRAVQIPARGEVEYTYEIVPTHFAEDRWVQMSEFRPGSPAHVHHAVVYIRPPDSQWLRHAPVGEPFTASMLNDPLERREAHETTSDLLLVYAPGSSPDEWPNGMAKFVPAESDLVFQMHYTTNGSADQDQTSIGLVFAKTPPKERVITLQLNNHALIIPPGADDFRVEVQGTLPNDATLLSLFPHMHLRGKRFEYDIVHDDGSVEVLLRVNYHFHWQLSYRLADPRALKAGTRLRVIAWYDNSRNNPHNPDPTKTVTWGDQTSDEMMVGFFDVAVPAGMDKWKFFVRHGGATPDLPQQ
jgi:Copper type II ascorbate-dependent monooxygenase, C-terminal domain